MRRLQSTMLRAVVYFSLVFAVGFVLGILRVLWVQPYVGERLAEVAEAPIMLAAIFLAARCVVVRLPASRRSDYALSGVAALLLLITVEFSVVLGLRHATIVEYVAERDPVAGSVYVLMLIVFAAMPWLLGKRVSDMPTGGNEP